jgi:hypothetical protein
MLTLGIHSTGTQWQRDIAISADDWLRHCYIVGATAMGTTVLLKQIMS